MTSLGDLCPCGDLAAPGHDLCSPCLEDSRRARAERQAATAELTALHEAKIIEAEEEAQHA